MSSSWRHSPEFLTHPHRFASLRAGEHGVSDRGQFFRIHLNSKARNAQYGAENAAKWHQPPRL